MSKRTGLVLLGVVAVLVGALGVFALSVRSVASDLTAARDELVAAQAAIGDRDVPAATAAMGSAAEHAAAASSAADGPLWSVAAAVPMIGATPSAVRAITDSLDRAVGALQPAVATLADVQPSELVGSGGRVKTQAIVAAQPTLAAAQEGVRAAYEVLAEAPSPAAGDLVLKQVDQARGELAVNLEELDDTLASVITIAQVLPPLVGDDGPKRYFFAILNPNEARGVGGFLGTWAIVTADQGKLSVEQVGSNSDIPTIKKFPASIDDDFIARYGDEAKLVSGMNISPNFPDAGALWLRAWREKTGERLDGALSADVVALGDLITATGKRVPLPDGGSLSGTELTDFALSGIYEKFPEAVESTDRKVYQEEVASAAMEVVTSGGPADAMASALAQGISEGRVLAWMRDDAVQAQIIDTPLGGALAVPKGPHATFVAIDSSASKLDTYLERSVRYGVGRCVDARNMVRSTFEVTLTSAIPKGVELPPYVISQADVGPRGPINSTLAQLHLPNGSQILEVEVNGEPAFYSPFTEQGRPSLVLDLELPARKPQTLSVLFREPRSGAAATAPEQPLVQPQKTEITSRPC